MGKKDTKNITNKTIKEIADELIKELKSNGALQNNVTSDVAFRRALGGAMGTSHNGDRDLWEVFGYPSTLKSQDFWTLYNRGDIANRIIRAFPSATWRNKPDITDETKNEGDEISPFSKAWNDLEREHKIYSFIERADRLSGLGQFSVLYMGFGDKEDIDKTLVRGNAKLLFMSPYSERNVTIAKFDTDEKSPRFGLPEIYTLTQGTIQGKTSSVKSLTVHHSRVIHIAEFLEDDEVYGTPRLMPIYNRLKDLLKVVGGSSEMFWLYARNILLGKAEKDAQLTEDMADAIKLQMDELVHQLRSYIMAQGIEFSNFQGQAPDPKPNAEVLLDLIAGAVGIPKRILMGTERGELASTQDENNWSERIAERRLIFASPFVLRPVIDKLIFTGNLPEPVGEYKAEWNEITNLTEAQRGDVALKQQQTLSGYANTPGVERFINDDEIRKSVGLDPDFEPDEIEEMEPLPEDEPEEEDEGDSKEEQNVTNEMTLKIVRDVNNGEIPRESGILLLIKAGMGRREAKKFIGNTSKEAKELKQAKMDELLKKIEDD